MTDVKTMQSTPMPVGIEPSDQPRSRRRVSPDGLIEVIGSLLAAAAIVWTSFTVAGLWAPFGMVVCSFLAFVLIYGALSWRLHGALRMKDRLGTVFVWAGAAVALTPLFFIIGWLLGKGLPVVLSHFPHFLTATSAQAGPKDPVYTAGVGSAIVGTVEQVGLAAIVALPLAFITATFLNESRSALSRIVQFVVDAMTGTPEIVAGLFVYLVWVQPHHNTGKSGFAASIALAVMMLPFVTRSAQEVLRIVPSALREAGTALGAPQWRLALRVVLPTARAGLVTVALLGVARAVGETAAVLLNAGGSSHQSFNWNPFHGIQLDLPLYVYQMAIVSPKNYVREAWGGALVLVLLVLVVFGLARLLGSGSLGKVSRSLARASRPTWRRASTPT